MRRLWCSSPSGVGCATEKNPEERHQKKSNIGRILGASSRRAEDTYEVHCRAVLPRGAAAKVRCRTRWRHRPAVNGGAGRATTLRSPRRRSGDLPFLHGYKKPEGQTNCCAHAYLALQLQESCFATPFEHGPRLRGSVLQNAHGTPTY